MYEGEVRAIQHMIKVVIVIVDLRRRELTLIHNIFGRERADVKALGERASYEDNRQIMTISLILRFR